MLPRSLRSMSLILLTVLALSPLVRAAEITEHVPENALGFVVVRNMAASSAKVETLTQMFEAPAPPLLGMFKLRTGFEAGLKEDGDLLIALLPPRDEFGSPGPLALVPVSDYAEFVQAFDGDPSGEICPVTIAGEDVLVAKKDEYALLMNPEYRDQMQQVVGAEPAAGPTVAALGEWIQINNAALVVMPAGAQMLIAMGQQGLAEAQGQLEQSFEDLDMQEELATLQMAFEVYGKMLGYVGDEVNSAAIGLAIDEAGNIKLGLRAVAKEEGQVAQIGPIDRGSGPLAGIPAGPFVVAGGAPWPEQLNDMLLGLSLDLMQTMPDVYGLGDATEEDLKQLEESFRKAVQGLRHAGFLLQPGKGDEPIYSNMYTIFDVEDTEAYMANYRESMAMWNEIASKGEGGAKFEYEMTDETVAGKPGMVITIDLSAAMGLPEVPQAGEMAEKMFGEDGKMRGYVAQVDESRVLVGYSSKANVEQLVETLRQSGPALADDPQVAVTARLLPAEAPFAMYISPQGAVSWFTRMMNVMMGAFGGGAPPIPEYPATPPVGIAAGLAGRVVETDIAFPVEMLQGLSKFIKENR